jgi:hypothetical protein
VAGFDASYVSKVVKGHKPPSQKFIDAVATAVLRFGRKLDLAALETEYPR